MGESISGATTSEAQIASLPNSAAILRLDHTLAVGSQVYEYFEAPYDSYFTGKVVRMPTARIKTISVKYSDNKTVECEEQEVRNNLDVTQLPLWEGHINKLTPAFDYLKSRITNTCEPQYHCAKVYAVFKVVRFFNPVHAAVHLTCRAWSPLATSPASST